MNRSPMVMDLDLTLIKHCCEIAESRPGIFGIKNPCCLGLSGGVWCRFFIGISMQKFWFYSLKFELGSFGARFWVPYQCRSMTFAKLTAWNLHVIWRFSITQFHSRSYFLRLWWPVWNNRLCKCHENWIRCVFRISWNCRDRWML